MTDLLIILGTVCFFIASGGFVAFCAHLMEG